MQLPVLLVHREQKSMLKGVAVVKILQVFFLVKHNVYVEYLFIFIDVIIFLLL